MSGWTVITLRAKPSEDYEKTTYDSSDPWEATADIAATMEDDSRVVKWTTWNSHVYAYLACSRYNFGYAEKFMQDYAEMAQDAVVLGANDTTDMGAARYYPNCETAVHAFEVEEREHGHVGERALATIYGKYGIAAKDPFHNEIGYLDDRYLEDGEARR